MAWRLRASRREETRQEVARGEAGGGRGLSGARHASPLFVLLAEEEEDKGEEVGWAGQMGQFWWTARVRPGKLGFSLSLSLSLFFTVFYFCSVFFYLICFATVLNLKIIQTMPKLL